MNNFKMNNTVSVSKLRILRNEKERILGNKFPNPAHIFDARNCEPTLWKLCLRSRGTVKNRFAEASRYFRSLNVLYLVCITRASRGVALSAGLGDRGAHEYHR